MRGRRLHLTVLSSTLAILALGLSFAYAQQAMNSSLFSGQPAIQITNPPLYYVWFDQSGWHVRWSSIGPGVFSGQIVTNGQVMDVRSQGRLASWVVPAGGRLVFLTGTVGGIDGFDFRTTGDALTFNLLQNQRLISPAQVVIGSGNARAFAMPFSVTTSAFAAGTAVPSWIDPSDHVGAPGEGR
ncbi:MAG TPA: hypothetical protein VFH67_07355 [bacterium]|nr:hypothetical protein [bacterium]